MPTRTEVASSHLRAFALDDVRVALVPEQAVLLAGDHVTVAVRVGAGRRLEVVEPGGTVAYAMRGSAARWDVRIEVEAGGSLVWHGEPFVVAEGADVARRSIVDLAADARVTLRETLVLGRIGEHAGRLVARTEVHRDGVPVLLEELHTDPERSGLGPNRVLDQLLQLGGRRHAESEHTMTLASGDQLHRWLGDETHASPLHQVMLCPWTNSTGSASRGS